MRLRVLFLMTIALLLLYTFLCISRFFTGHALLSGLASISIMLIVWLPQLRRNAGHEKPYVSAIARISSFCLGLWSSFILFCLCIDAISLVLLLARLANMRGLADFDRVYGVRISIAIAAIAASFTSLVGLVQATRGPRVKRVSVPIHSLPKELEGLKIAQISDLHIGAVIRKGYIAYVVRKVLALAPDIIAITGDIADGTPELLREHTQPMAALKAPLGTYYITGNHEYYFGAPAWIAEARRLGFTPLVNENRILRYKQRNIMVAGVTDISAHQFIPAHRSDPHKAAVTDAECDLRILLAHQPESYVAAQAAGFDIQLSGHTHAGQFFPFNMLVRLVKRYAKGLYRHKSLWVYVNAGTGFWGAINRFAVPAEITLLELSIG